MIIQKERKIMKKLLLLLTLVTLFTIGFNTQADAQNISYNKIDVFNSNGVNSSDFAFTYDKGTCINNFLVINNLNFTQTFNFKIYLNGEWKYTGKVTVFAYKSVFFNNAFIDCNAITDNIKIVCY